LGLGVISGLFVDDGLVARIEILLLLLFIYLFIYIYIYIYIAETTYKNN